MLLVLTAWTAVPAVGALVVRRVAARARAASSRRRAASAARRHAASAARAGAPSGRRAARPCRGRRRRAASTTSRGRGPSPTRYGSSDGHGRKTSWRMSSMPAVDVAADVVRVVRLHRGRPVRRAGQDPVAEPGREALDLGLDPVGHVDRRAGRDVAVRPGGRLARPARATGPTARTGRTARTAAPGGGRRRPPPRDAAISSSVPPRWTVAARRGPSAAHGTGPSSAQSTLKTPGP